MGFDDRLLALGGIILNTQTVMAIYYTGAFFKVKFKDYLLCWLGEFLVISILWIVIRSLYIQIAKKFRGFENVKKRLSVMPFFLIPYLAICLLYLVYVQHFFKWDYAAFPEPGIPVQLATGAIILYANLGFYECIFLVIELKNTKLKEERRKKENVTSQLLNLRNQVSPHFLFNSLNTLMYLIDEDKEKSKQFVHRLSKIYNRILKLSDKDFIPLKEELDYINEYMELLKKRHGENISYNLNISPWSMNKMIVPLALQVGIENAVKHNVIFKKNPLTINVRNQDNYIVIDNNLQKKNDPTIQNGMGLKNIKNRYKLLSEKEMVIEETDTKFSLMFPLLEPMN